MPCIKPRFMGVPWTKFSRWKRLQLAAPSLLVHGLGTHASPNDDRSIVYLSSEILVDQVSRARDDFSTKSLLYLFSLVENDAPWWLLLVSFFWHFLFVASRCNFDGGIGVRTQDRAGSFPPDP